MGLFLFQPQLRENFSYLQYALLLHFPAVTVVLLLVRSRLLTAACYRNLVWRVIHYSYFFLNIPTLSNRRQDEA